MTAVASRRGLAFFALTFALVASLLVPALSEAGKKNKKPGKTTVMSRNVFLGADLGPAINAADTCEAVDAGGAILNEVDLTNFPERSKLLAAEIINADPDLVGLQEVALWRFQEESDFTGSPATEVRYDFLELLMTELAKQGGKYKVAVSQDEFDQELPADRDGSDATQDASFPLCGADEDGRLTMRDVILVNKANKVKTKNPQMGQFENTYDVVLGGVVPISVDRGWVSVDAKVKGTKKRKSSKFHFVNTHLEAFGDPQIREAQARELFEKGGPLRTNKQLIFLGDINSGNKKDRIGQPFTDPEDPLAYNALTRDFDMKRLGVRQTCCFPSVVRTVIGAYRLDHTVDHVMSKPKVKQTDGFVTGANPSVTTPSGLVASDHAGVVSELKLKPKKKK